MCSELKNFFFELFLRNIFSFFYKGFSIHKEINTYVMVYIHSVEFGFRKKQLD